MTYALTFLALTVLAMLRKARQANKARIAHSKTQAQRSLLIALDSKEHLS